MPASRFLKIVQETGQIPVCSFYLPVSTSRNPTVCKKTRVFDKKQPEPIIFPREEKLWNFGGTHKTHKRCLTGSTGSTGVGKEGRDNVDMVHVHLF